MNLGILVNADKNLPDIVGISKAAISKGHKITIFAMDTGTRLLEKSSFTELSDIEGVAMSFCDHSARDLGVKTDGISEKIKGGSQVNNAIMNQGSDKVIVL